MMTSGTHRNNDKHQTLGKSQDKSLIFHNLYFGILECYKKKMQSFNLKGGRQGLRCCEDFLVTQGILCYGPFLR